MDEYGEEKHGSWTVVIVLAVLAAIALALLLTDTPGRIADASTAQAMARAEIERAAQAGHTERIEAMLIAFNGIQPVVYVLGGLLLGWWLRGREQAKA